METYKIILNPKECGYRSKNSYLDGLFSCLNPKCKNTVCDDPMTFPDNCPLQDCLYPRSINKHGNKV